MERWLQGLRQLLRRNLLAALASVLVLVLILIGLFAPVLAPYDPTRVMLAARNNPPMSVDATGMHLLGNDHLGRDLYSRILFGLRLSLFVGFTSMFVGALIGGFVGLFSGYLGGRVDDVAMRLVDLWLGFPYILLAIVLAAFWGTGLWQVVVIIGVRGWVDYARVIRGSVLSMREEEFILAARALGITTPGILLRHIVPNLLGPIVVIATFQIGRAIVLEATLSFLGLGINPPTPSLGSILFDGRAYLGTAWWAVAFSGATLTMIVLAVNLFGDGLRDFLDPRR